jgi:hypothetical protein
MITVIVKSRKYLCFVIWFMSYSELWAEELNDWMFYAHACTHKNVIFFCHRVSIRLNLLLFLYYIFVFLESYILACTFRLYHIYEAVLYILFIFLFSYMHISLYCLPILGLCLKHMLYRVAQKPLDTNSVAEDGESRDFCATLRNLHFYNE